MSLLTDEEINSAYLMLMVQEFNESDATINDKMPGEEK